MGRPSRERERQRQARGSGREDPPGLFGAAQRPSQRRLAEQIIGDAVHARHRGDIFELERCQALLTEEPGGTAGIQIVNRALLTCLLREIEHAWRRGWQPSELVRVARREHTPRHGRLMLDGVAAQLRGYPAATVDHRWRSQLDALNAQVWWEHDDQYLTTWGEQQNADRAEVVSTVVEVLHLLATLPPLEPVGPMPGSAVSAPATPPADLDQKMLHRVRALLAKAESTDFPEEAEALTAKAQDLMARHRIDHALLVATKGEHDQPVTRRVGVDHPYEAPKTLLLQVIAEANNCRAVWLKRFGFTSVVGFPADLDATELLFTSLLVQATRAMAQATPAATRSGRNTTRSFRQSFLTAYASRIGERLETAAETVDQEMATSSDAAQFLPVLAARDDAVREVFEQQFPGLTQHTTTVSNSAGWASGRAAADRASLQGRPVVAAT